jgi:hypothetical protein
MLLPSALDDAELPLPELMAARLDGELYPLADAHCPIDQPETPQVRLAAVLAGRPSRVIAELGTAAWVWGALLLPPPRPELCVDLNARARPQPTGQPSVREVVVSAGDLRVLGDRSVTSPLRTAVDLARVRAPFTADDAGAVLQLARIGRFGLADCETMMNRRRNLPGKRRALERLRAALGSAALDPLRASARVHAVHVVDGFDAPHGVQQAVEVHGVAHLEHEPAERQAIARGRDGGRQDVDVVLREHPRHVREQPRSVEGLHLDLHEEHAR